MVAVDAGTTGVRTLAFDEAGAVLDAAYRPLTQHFPRPGWVEHDPEEIVRLVVETLAEVAGRLTTTGSPGTPVAAVGITNQRETAVAWDRRTGRPRHPAVVWQDRRTAPRCRELSEAGRLEVVRATTGLVLDPYFSATKFEWLLSHGGVERSVDLALGTVDAWLLWHLTGGPEGGTFVTDATNASRTMLLDIRSCSWSEELCDLFDVPVTALAEVRPSCGRLGAVAGPVADAVPHLAGVPISGVAGDQQSALFGQACFEPGMAKVTYGTGSFVLVNAGPRLLPPCEGLVTTVAWDLGDHSPDGPSPLAYALEGSTFVSGAALDWLVDGIGIVDRVDGIERLAGSVGDTGGLVLVPAFAGLGSPWWDPRARGAMVGVTRGTGRPQLVRAAVEAIALGVRDMVDAVTTATGRPCPELRADGGASVMELLLQMQADQVGIPVVRPRCVESTALGAAMLAGLAEGVWTFEDLGRLWQPDVVCQPVLDRARADAVHDRWLSALERSRRWAPV